MPNPARKGVVSFIGSKLKEDEKVKVLSSLSGGALILKPCGEMDEYSAPSARAACDELIARAPAARKVIVDLSGMTFMDSSGIGFLIGRYKKARAAGKAMYVSSPDLAADKVLSLSGVYSLIPRADK